MSQQPFFKGLSWLLLLNLLVKPLWIFAIDRQVQVSVGHESYGKYFAVLSLTIILNFAADAGLTNMMNQRIANGTALNFRHLLGIKLLLLSIYLVLCLLLATLTRTGAGEILFYTSGIQALASLFIFLRSIITAHQLFQTDAWLSVLDKTGMMVICGVFLYFPSIAGGISLERFLQVQLLCMLAAVAVSLVLIYKNKLPSRGAPLERPLPLLSATLPFTLIVLLMAMHYRLDGFLLERLHARGAFEAGVYAAAYRLLDAANTVGYLSASFLVPYVARHAADRVKTNQSLLLVRHGLMTASLAAVSFCFVFAPWIMEALYHTSDAYHAGVLKWCMAALPGYFLVHVYGSALTATRQLSSFLLILVFCVVLNAGLNLAFIPKYGAMAAVMAAVASQWLCGLLCFAAAVRRLKLSVHYPSLLAYLLFAMVFWAALYVAKMAFLNVWVILAVAALLFLLLFWMQRNRLKKYFLSLR
jgi:O-antigen/teichoic acid export membrane protein